MQLEIGMSTSRYLPANGTAGLERSLVSGNSREPAPPPMITARTFTVFGADRFCPILPALSLSFLAPKRKPQRNLLPFGVRWLDTAFNCEGQSAFEHRNPFEIQSGVEPPHSKRLRAAWLGDYA